MARQKKLDSLQALRALAAVAVVFHHVFRATTVFMKPADNSLLLPSADFIQFGAAGVDIFFILSGFLMTYISAPYFSGDRSPRDFIAQRLIRIWPTYALVTLLACLLLLESSWRSKAAFDLQPLRLASIFFVPSFDQHGKLAPIIGPGWTLYYEMLFYFCFMNVLATGRSLAFLKLFLIISIIYLIGIIHISRITDAFFGNPIIFEFLIGAGLGFVQSSGRLNFNWPRLLIALSGILLLIFNHIGLGEKQRLLAYGLPAGFLFAGFISLNSSTRWPRMIVLLGNASYSIYLIHTLVIYKVTSHVSFFDNHGLGRLSTLLTSVLAILIAVFAGLAFYWVVERPILRMLQSAYRNQVVRSSDASPA